MSIRYDLRKLVHVVAVAREGSVSKAAEKLHLSQPALSRSISLVEDRMGVQIFSRGHQGAELTAVGRIIVDEAEGLINRAKVFEHNIELHCRGEAGVVAFGMWPLLGSVFLPKLSTYFVVNRPKLKVRAVIKSANTLLENLIEDEIEVFFYRSGQIDLNLDFKVETIGSIQLAVLVRSSHPLADRDTVREADIQSYPMLSGVDIPEIPPEFMSSGVFCCDNIDVMRYTALNTDSAWIVPPQLAQPELESGELHKLTVVDKHGRPIPMVDITIDMVHLAGYDLSPSCKAVVDYVKEQFHIEKSG